jgi:hypothetical protein
VKENASVSAYESDAAMPVTNVTKEIYRLAMRGGHATEDFLGHLRLPYDDPSNAAAMNAPNSRKSPLAKNSLA